MGVNPIPEGYHSVTPYLIVDGAAELLDFVKNAFGAEERFRMPAPNDTVGHAEVKIGDSIVMVADGGEEWPVKPTFLYLYVDNCDATYQRALEAGATSVKEPEDQFYGDRNATVADPVGNTWGIATHIEDVTEEEVAKRLEAMASQPAG